MWGCIHLEVKLVHCIQSVIIFFFEACIWLTPLYNDISVIMYARNTLLFSNGEPCVRKGGDKHFDVAIGCHYGVEICELIGTYLLNQINNVISKGSIGLIRDDELVIFKNTSVPEVERKKEDLIRTFKTNRLSTVRFKQIERC